MQAIKQEEQAPKGLRLLYDFVEILVSALLVIGVLFAFGLRQARVDGRSMMDTLYDGERLLLSNFLYTPQRGDIVVVNRYDTTKTYTEAELTSQAEPLVKRVIGVAGDTVTITETTVYINGEALDEPYVHYENDIPFIQQIDENGQLTAVTTVTVPEGCVFVMGDHRNNSKDSRYADVGFVEVDNIMGKAVWRLTPFGRFGSLYEDE